MFREFCLEYMSKKIHLNRQWFKDHRWQIWKTVLILILLGTLFFIYQQRDNFLLSKRYLDGVDVEFKTKKTIEKLMPQYENNPEELAKDTTRMMLRIYESDHGIDMDGNKEVIQYFKAEESRIAHFNLVFGNKDSSMTQGIVRVYLETEGGDLVEETELPAAQIANFAVTRFSMTGNTAFYNANNITSSLGYNRAKRFGLPIEKGKRYRYRIVSENVSSKSGLLLRLNENKSKSDNTLVVDGKEVPGEHLFATEEYKYFSITLFSVFLIGIFFGIVFVIIPWNKISKALNKKLVERGKPTIDLERWLLRIMFLLTPLFETVMLAKIAGMRLDELLALVFNIRGLLNLMLIGCFMWIFYTVTNRIKAAIVLVTALCLALGFTNYALLQFRDSPLMAADIVNINTAMQVTSTYKLEFDKSALWAIMLSAVWVCAALSLHGGRGPRWKGRVVCIAVAVAWALLCNSIVLNNEVLRRNHIKVSSFRPRVNYSNNGYMLSFLVSANMVRVEKPEKYSVKRVESIMEDYQSDKAVEADGVSIQNPNIIVIMNESFSDLRANGDFETNKEYMPYYYSLKENTIKGVAHSSVYGGQTACSEFECLTGFTMNFLPFHSVPYTSIMKTTTPSLTYKLEASGYGGLIAFHPGMASSYNRENAYPKVGFKEHISAEDMDNPEKIRAYVSDKADYQRVESEYEDYQKSEDGDKPFFLFNVTIQNHGSYTYSNGIVDAGVSINDPLLQQEQAVTFVNLMKKSDEALEQLIRYFSKVKEPTVIMLFGDHQPRIEPEFYTNLDAQNESIRAGDRKYQVPFMIWSNFDIEEKEDVQISNNYLSAYLMQQLGGEMSAYDKYLMNLYETLPVITDIVIMDNDGRYYNPDDENPYTDLLNEYQIVQYNGLIDTKHRLNELFELE